MTQFYFIVSNMVLAVFRQNVVERYTFFDTKTNVARDLRKQDPTYTYLEPGFFRVVLWPMLPILTVLHLLHFYGIYLLLTGQAKWECLIASECALYVIDN